MLRCITLLLCLLPLLVCCSTSGGSHGHDVTTGDASELSTAADTPGPDGDTPVSDVPLDPPPLPGSCAPNDAPFPQRPAVETPATLPFLRVDGREIVDEAGNPVALRGINFGSWLMLESWISGFGKLSDEELLDLLRMQAADLGVGDLLAKAEAASAADWVLERKSHWVVVMDWKEYMTANAPAGKASAVVELWEWFAAQPWLAEEEAVWEWLAGRFGFSAAEELRLLYQRHYITELDVERVAALGLNLIRVPIWYRSLETDFAQDNDFRPDGWLMLHDLALWARKHGVYLMLDLHGAPGGQSTSWHQGLKDGGHLWERPECLNKTTRLWQALASYFANDPHVAVYDLLNEPMSFPAPESYVEVHDAIYQAIREVDGDHIVMIEDAYRPLSQLTSPDEMGWTNAMFSIHLYPGGTSAQDYLDRIEDNLTGMEEVYLERFDCPLFLGEFSAADGTDSDLWAPSAMGPVLARLNERGVHWAPWTWKYFDSPTWGLYHPLDGAGERIDLAQGSFEELQAAFLAQDSAGFVADPEYATALEDSAGAPVSPLDLGSL